MNNSKQNILTQIQTGLKRSALSSIEQKKVINDYAANAVHPKISYTQDLVDRLIEKSKLNSASVELINDIKQLPDLVNEYIAKHHLEKKLLIASDLAKLSWSKNINISHLASDGSHKVALVNAYAGIAETGSIVILSSPATPTSHNFLADHYLVLLKRSDIYKHMEDVWDDSLAAMPRCINFITGPSRTGDIEQTIQLGAHGPRSVHIYLLDA